MKNTFFVLIICLLPAILKAQDDDRNFKLGFTLSPNIGWLGGTSSDSEVNEDGARAGFSYGVLADVGFAKNYFFSTAFTLTSVGSKIRLNGIASSEETYKIQYLEVPLTLKLKSNPDELGRFYGQFGLGTGIKVKARKDFKYGTESGEDIDASKDINIFRLSMILGAGAEWNVGRNLSVMTGLTYNNGITKIFDKGPDGRNSYVALTLGVFF